MMLIPSADRLNAKSAGLTPVELVQKYQQLVKEHEKLKRQQEILKKALGILSETLPTNMP